MGDSRVYRRYQKLRELLDRARNEGDQAQETLILKEMDNVWEQLSVEEQSTVDTNPGIPPPFEDAT